MAVVESFVSATIANIHIKKPYTDLPEEPVNIFWGGNAKKRKMSKPPVARMLKVEEKMDVYLTEIMKINENITKEFASIIPGEPAVHLTALIHTSNQKKRIKSPGRERDCCIPKIEKL